MKKLLIYLSRISVTLTLFLTMFHSAASGESLEGKWTGGLRLGPSFLLEELSEDTKGEPGLIVNSHLFYGITRRFLLGINIEWERHEIRNRTSDFRYGDESTVSIFPTAEYHLLSDSSLSPYFFLGVGINMNSFRKSSDLDSACANCRLDPRNTLALKGGIGIDYSISSSLAFNGELGVKLNDGTSDMTGSFPGILSGTSTNNRACVLTLILGVRFF